LLIQGFLTYDYVIGHLLPDHLAGEAGYHVSRLETRVRQVEPQSPEELRSLLEEARNQSAEEIAWVRIADQRGQQVDIRAGLDNALALITSEMRGNVDIVKEYGDIPEIIGRPRELNQVFMALLVNAFQAMNGQGTLTITTASSKENVTVEISDTGRGIDPQKIESLFEIGLETGKGRVGLALGLPTSFRIVEEHGGSLTVRSEVDKGSSFIVALPIHS
jgi:signal transduction histidine kinase